MFINIFYVNIVTIVSTSAQFQDINQYSSYGFTRESMGKDAFKQNVIDKR